jgi:hypothetical protein
MNWKQFNLHNFVPILSFFILGMIAGLIYPSDTKPTKEYPIQVSCYWESGGMQSYPTMEADSVKGDTIWKDGNKIVNKNIINVEFK